MRDDLARLKAQRDALNAEITLIERGIERAAYDASMSNQLMIINASRAAEGKPPLSMAAWRAGVEGEH